MRFCFPWLALLAMALAPAASLAAQQGLPHGLPHGLQQELPRGFPQGLMVGGAAAFEAPTTSGTRLGPGATPDPQRAVDQAVAELSLRRHVLWGAVLGGSAGVVTGLLVRHACDEPCDDSVAQGLALHVGVGAVTGGAAGAVVYWLRQERRP